jgi:FAD:protein FMN transferase
MRNLTATLFLLFAIIPLLGGQALLRLERSAPAMGTTFTIDIYGREVGIMQAAADGALEEAARIDKMLSNYQPDSELSRVNERAATGPVKISPELFDLLTACVAYSRASEGTFDITVGPLMNVWGFYKDSGHLPHRSEVTAALARVGYRNIELDPTSRTVHFTHHGINLDPGGVGKGYAVDKMVGVLKENGITCALISAGGSSIYGIGAPPDDPRGWYVRIRDPKDEKKTAAEIYLRDKSLSTSGNYEKFFWAEGKLYSHIMDPRTGFPAEGMLSVSVMSPKTLDSEVWAKPYYILGRDWTRSQKPRDFEVLLCEDKPGATCAWVR